MTYAPSSRPSRPPSSSPWGATACPTRPSCRCSWEGDRLVGHLARANAHWRRIVDGSPALAIVTGPDTYVSPSWYATKAEHGKVVPTWNYSVVHLRGRIVVHDDPAWVHALVTRLTDRHESPARRAVGGHRRARGLHRRRTSARSSASSLPSSPWRRRPS